MDELHDYLQAPADGNWLAKLAQAVASQRPPETRWEAAQTETEQLLERWIIGLDRFGREPLVKVAVAAAQPTLAIWEGDAAWHPPVVDEIV